jgi:thiamine pyrophosphokinase
MDCLLKKKQKNQLGKWACLIGGGPTSIGDMRILKTAQKIYCADGGANIAFQQNFKPDVIIGDGDSISPAAEIAFSDLIVKITDQDTTDFEKCLNYIKDDSLLCFGFIGGRLDHQLAAFSALAKFPQKSVVLIGEDEIVFLCRNGLEIDLPIGSNVALYPLNESRVTSTGLVWETGDIDFTPTGMLGTSNKMAHSHLSLSKVSGSMIVILPRMALNAVMDSMFIAA